MKAFAIGGGDQPDVMRLLVSLNRHHSSVNGLKPIASNFSTSPGVGGGGVGSGSVLITCSSSLNIYFIGFCSTIGRTLSTRLVPS